MSRNTKKPFVIIDGFAIFFRAYYSHPEMLSVDNLNINAVFGFMNMVLRLIRDFAQSDICVALDSGKSTFRDKMFSDYKANRQATPEDLKPQFPIMIEAISAIGLPWFICEGYEADDIIATCAKKASADNREVVIVSLDKDLTQLIRHSGVYMYDFSKKKKIGRDCVFKKFGIMPEYIADYLALVGDSSDNIPGVKTIGVKTAVDLITRFGNLESIYANLDGIEREKTRNALRVDRANAFLSKTLAELCETVDMPHPENISFKGVDIDALAMFSKKYNLRIHV